MTALAHHLWQSTAFAAAAALLAFALRRHHARTRFWIWMAASLKFLVPFAVLTGIGTEVGSHAPLPPIANPQIALRVEHVAIQWSAPPGLPGRPVPLPALVLALWCAGVLFVSARWTREWLRLRAVLRLAAPSAVPFPIPVRSTASTLEPGVFGIFRPVLLLPAGIAARLTPTQLQAILEHELAHLRRRDNLWSAVHMLVEALVWFHPLVWWVGARLIEERERACDEEVLRRGSMPEVYAESILAACRLYFEAPLPCVSGVTGADLKRRIERIMSGCLCSRLTPAQKLLLGCTALAALALPFSAGLLLAQSPAFDAATVKLFKPGSAPENESISAEHGRLVMHQQSLHDCIQWAYDLGLDPHEVQGPKWMDSERYEISAVAPASTTEEQLQRMMQTLLADRFKLSFHRKTEVRPVFTLETVASGFKLRDLHQPPVKQADMQTDGRSLTFHMICRIQDLVQFLPTMVDRHVLDKTGLAGVYDFSLRVETDPKTAFPHPGSQFEGFHLNAGAVNEGLEPMGLRLVAEKGPVDIFVIDHAEHP